MSPRLLFLLTTLRTQHRFERDRDRTDARLAATRTALRPLVSQHAVLDPIDTLPVAA